MDGDHRFKRLRTVAVMAMTALIIGACAIQLRGSPESPASATSQDFAVTADLDLTRCRAVTAEQTAELEKCRKVWAENRRRFLSGRGAAPAKMARPEVPNLELPPKDSSRLPQDRSFDHNLRGQ